MRLGIFARTFPGDEPGPIFAAMRAAGYGSTQYNFSCSGLPSMPDAISQAVTDAVRTASESQTIEIVAVSGTYNMIHPEPAVRERGHARLAVIAAAARHLPSRLVTLCTGTRDPDDQWRRHPDNTTPEAWADLLASMELALEIAERYDVDVGVEPEQANVVSSADRARALIDELRSPRLKIVLDPANLIEPSSYARQQAIVSHAVAQLADRIALAHAKDRDRSGAFATAGTGVLDYPHVVASLRDAGFDGPLVTHSLAAEEAAPVARFLSRTLAEAGVASG
jgi:sugar phosphate isomerase/epimerase